MTAPYERLLTLARAEHQLAGESDFEGLEQIDAERSAVVAALPPVPPGAGRPLLVEAAQIQAATTALLTEARSRIAAELGATERRSHTARGYGRLATPARGTFTAAA